MSTAGKADKQKMDDPAVPTTKDRRASIPYPCGPRLDAGCVAEHSDSANLRCVNNKETLSMVWSKWKATLAVTVAWAGLAQGQQSQTPPAPTPVTTPVAERYLTIQEKDKGPMQCLILKTYVNQYDGTTVQQVRSPQGEILEIVEKRSQMEVVGQAAPTNAPVRNFIQNIFNRNKTLPPGTMVPIESGPVMSNGGFPTGTTPVATAPYPVVGAGGNSVLVPTVSSVTVPQGSAGNGVPFATLGNGSTTISPEVSNSGARTTAATTSSPYPIVNSPSSPGTVNAVGQVTTASVPGSDSLPYATVNRPSVTVTTGPGSQSPVPSAVPPVPAAPVVVTTGPGSQSPVPTQAEPVAKGTLNQPGVFREGEIRTIQDVDGTMTKCRVVRTFYTAEGRLACEVVGVDTGEKMTIVEAGPASVVQNAPGGKMRAMAARIIHWGRSNTPPPGTPLPPPNLPPANQAQPGSGAQAQPYPMVAKLQQMSPSGGIAQGTKSWSPAYGPPSANNSPIPSTAPTAICQNCVEGTAPVDMTVTYAAPRPSLFQRIGDRLAGAFGNSSSGYQVAQAAPPAGQITAPMNVATAGPGPLPPTMTGPTEIAKTLPTDKAWDPKATSAVDLPGKPQVDPKLPPSGKLVPLPQLAQSETGKANTDDPLARPEIYASKVAEQKLNLAKDPPAPTTASLVTAPPSLPPIPPLPPPPPPTLPPFAKPAAVAQAPQSQQGMQPPQGTLPLGSKSVIEAYNGLNSQIKYMPMPIVTVPQPNRPPLPPVPEIPQAPQPERLRERLHAPATAQPEQLCEARSHAAHAPHVDAPWHDAARLSPGHGPGLPAAPLRPDAAADAAVWLHPGREPGPLGAHLSGPHAAEPNGPGPYDAHDAGQLSGAERHALQ